MRRASITPPKFTAFFLIKNMRQFINGGNGSLAEIWQRAIKRLAEKNPIKIRAKNSEI